MGSLASEQMINVVIDNSAEGYASSIEDLKKKGDYVWIHVKNAYSGSAKPAISDPNFIALDSLAQISGTSLFNWLTINTKHFTVHRNAKLGLPELRYWRPKRKCSSSVTVKGLSIIHGKKVGRTLGIPTGELISEFRRSDELSRAARTDTWNLEGRATFHKHQQFSA